MKFVLCLALSLSIALAQAPKARTTQPTLQEIMKSLPVEDQQKLMVLMQLMVGAHREPVRWDYRVVEVKSSISAAKLGALLNGYGAAGFELVSSAAVSVNKTRYILKAKHPGTPNSL